VISGLPWAAIGVIVLELLVIVFLVLRLRRPIQSDPSLSGRLIRSAELERKQLAHQLHGDLGQRLSLASLELDTYRNELQDPASPEFSRLGNMIRDLNQLTSDVHDLSHQLYSSKLQHLGLEAAVRELCRHTARRHQLEIDLVTEAIPESLPDDLALCYYRILQDALDNVVKHSLAKRAEVALVNQAGVLRMSVSDSGVGFDSFSTTQGLGLAKMREWIRLLGGSFHLESKSGQGARISVEIPLPPNLPGELSA